MKQLGVRIPKEIIESVDSHVDGVKFRSRAHLITVLVLEWLEKQKKHPHQRKKEKNE